MGVPTREGREGIEQKESVAKKVYICRVFLMRIFSYAKSFFWVAFPLSLGSPWDLLGLLPSCQAGERSYSYCREPHEKLDRKARASQPSSQASYATMVEQYIQTAIIQAVKRIEQRSQQRLKMRRDLRLLNTDIILQRSALRRQHNTLPPEFVPFLACVALLLGLFTLLLFGSSPVPDGQAEQAPDLQETSQALEAPCLCSPKDTGEEELYPQAL